MADTRKIVRVFLASPGDLGEERQAAKDSVDEINGLLANELGYHVELVGWEDTVSVFGRPQAIINAELDRCELFVGLIWRRWGTPPASSGPYTSGFEEEFRRSMDRREKEGRPEISLLLKAIPPEFLRDPGDDLKKVLDFRKQLIDEKKILFEDFTDLRAFEIKFRRCISKYVMGLRAREVAEISDERQVSPTTDEQRRVIASASPLPATPFSPEGAKFLNEFVLKTASVGEELQIDPIEIARFRLLGNVIWARSNDQITLGVHDANVLFANANDVTFGDAELLGLVRSGLANYRDENVPLWRWYAETGGFAGNLLSIFTSYEPTEIRTGALSAMRLISEPLPPNLDRRAFLTRQLSKDEPNPVKVAALAYFGEFGIVSDIPAIEEELDRHDYQTIGPAIDAILRVHLRDSREKAINKLYELQPASINQNLLELIFENSSSLDKDLLLRGITHQNADVRRRVVALLRSRHELPSEIAEQLTADGDAGVRYEALKSLVEGGRDFSNAEAERILVKPASNRGLGLLGGLGSEGQPYWRQFRNERLAPLPATELEEAAREASIFDQDAKFVLAEREFLSDPKKLRSWVDNQFKAEFEKSIGVMAQRFGGPESDLIQQTRSLEAHLRRDFTAKGLDIICRRLDPVDLRRVRG
jgi:hypothetical protein